MKRKVLFKCPCCFQPTELITLPETTSTEPDDRFSLVKFNNEEFELALEYAKKPCKECTKTSVSLEVAPA